MQAADAGAWRSRVEGVVRGAVAGTPMATVTRAPEPQRRAFARDFRDDAGHRRQIDDHVLAWVLGLTPWAEPDPTRPDALLWHALAAGLPPPALPGDPPEAGPVAPAWRERGIEVWTQVELACLQALWWHGTAGAPTPDRRVARARAESLARWLMAEMQPDNATNHAWAVAPFAMLAAGGDPDAGLYAETLLHNCQVTMGRADRFSALLLLDAMACLEMAGG